MWSNGDVDGLDGTRECLEEVFPSNLEVRQDELMRVLFIMTTHLSGCVSNRRRDSARMLTSSIQTDNNKNISKVGDEKAPVNFKSDEKSMFPISIISLDDELEAQI